MPKNLTATLLLRPAGTVPAGAVERATAAGAVDTGW